MSAINKAKTIINLNKSMSALDMVRYIIEKKFEEYGHTEIIDNGFVVEAYLDKQLIFSVFQNGKTSLTIEWEE